ncbi:ABC transporter substrate-binding protein [Comamonas humi]
MTTTSGLQRLRFILNTYYSGPQAWFYLADDRGYFRDEGLQIDFTEGDTAANAVPKLASGAFDVGYGDMNALIELAAQRPGEAPIAVYAMHNQSPYTIAVPADGPIRTPADLRGRKLVSHVNDAAWRMFPEFAHANGFDPAEVTVEFSDLRHREIVPLMLQGRWDGLFGFVNTVAAGTMEAGLDPKACLRHLEWRHHVPSLYGAALMVTPQLRREQPEVVAGLVRAVNRGVADAVADLDAAIDAVARRNPNIDRVANRARLAGTLALEMGHAEGARHGIGDIDEARLAEAIACISAAKHFATAPSAAQVFDRGFLPAPEQRVRSLG